MENQGPKYSLFDDQQTGAKNFKLNKQYAESFQKRKERELIDKYKAKYGSNYQEQMEDEMEDSESDYSQEDEDGQLIDEELTDNFIQTIAKIRMKHPDIYKEKKIFQEKDEEQHSNKKDSKQTYDRIEIRTLMDRYEKEDEVGSSSEEHMPNNITHNEEQERIKNEFKVAASTLPTDADQLLKKKTKTVNDIRSDDQVFQGFIERMKAKEPKNDVDILKRFWGKESDLDDKDKFLRKFILTKGWVDRDDIEDNLQDSEEYEEKADKYEEKYNFRYEEPGGTQITTYERNVEGIVREGGNEKRRAKRHEKDERMKAQKQTLRDELKALKLAKRDQLVDRINKIYEVGGLKNQDSKKILKDITEDFDDRNFDRAMEDMYNENFYEEVESDDQEIKDDIDQYFGDNDADQDEEQQIKKQKKMNSNLDDAIENALDIKQQVPLMMRKNLKDDQLKAIQEDGKVSIWWYCDNCKQGIQPLQQRWDCQVCEDYALCKECFSDGYHKEKNHKVKRMVVPKDCFVYNPPEQNQLDIILAQFHTCATCEFKLSEENDYYKREEAGTGEEIVLCDECIQDSEDKGLFERVKAVKINLEAILDKNPEKLKQQIQDVEIQKLVDDYNNLDFEDVIAGGIKTRFKYIDTEPLDYGLTDDDLLYCDDALLNQYISIKKIFPYVNEPVTMRPSRMRQMMELVRKSTKRNKKGLFKEQNKLQKLEDEIEELKKQKGLKGSKKQGQIEVIQEKMEKIQVIRGNKNKKIKTSQPEVEIEDEPMDQVELPQNRLKAYGIKSKK